MEILYCVYRHTNKLNNKKYVGITSKQDVSERWQKGSGYFNNKHFYNAIKKYGWDTGFTHEILAENLQAAEAKQLEIALIAKYDLTNPDFGYNKSKGGDGYLIYDTEEDRIAAHSAAMKRAKQKRKSDPIKADLDKQINRQNYYRHMQDPEYKKTRRDNMRAKVKESYETDPVFKTKLKLRQNRYYGNITELRNKLREYYKINPNYFTEQEAELAFAFNSNRKNYKCQSAVKLRDLLVVIEERAHVNKSD